MRIRRTKPTLAAVFLALLVLVVLACSAAWAQQPDPLPSWAEGPTKSGIVQFVDDVTIQGGPKYVRPEERIATFDNDGTLWCEQPLPQMEFVMYQLKKMAPQHPEWKNQQPYKSILEGDKNFLLNDLINNHGRALMELVVATHAGMPIEEFNNNVIEFFNTARHPKYNKKYTETIYQPMLELFYSAQQN